MWALPKVFRLECRDDGINPVHASALEDTHEQIAARLAHEVGFTQISASHQVSPLQKLVGRGDTTVVDAYLSPILRRHVAIEEDHNIPRRSVSTSFCSTARVSAP